MEGAPIKNVELKDGHWSRTNSKGVRWGVKLKDVAEGYMANMRKELMPTSLTQEIEHRKRVEELRATGATDFHSRENGETRPNGIMDYLRFKGMLSTPNAQDYNTTWSEEQKQKCLARRAVEGKTAYPSKFNALKQMAVEGRLPGICPTPGVRKKGGQTYGETLPDTVARIYATPRACSAMAAPFTENTGKNQNQNLEVQIANLCYQKTDGESFRLSPMFTEEMMGFPLMWTALPFLSQNGETRASKPTETQ